MIALGSDHAGRGLKEEIKKLLDQRGLEYVDFGTDTDDSCDYPVFGFAAASAVADGKCDRGLLFCGTGVGISLAANKVKGIRCVVCSEPYSAKMSRLHNDSNMLALGSRVVGTELARMIVETWLDTDFEGGRHQRRVDLISAIEESGSVG